MITSSTLFFLAAAGISALACFTVELNKVVTLYDKVHYGWSYFSGWAAVVFTFVCSGSSIASSFKRRTNVHVGCNMQVILPSNQNTSVPYNQFTVSTTTNRVI